MSGSDVKKMNELSWGIEGPEFSLEETWIESKPIYMLNIAQIDGHQKFKTQCKWE